ncbi:MAG TPA: MBG domain-containing protein [Verrucomicrobiae bacterium]
MSQAAERQVLKGHVPVASAGVAPVDRLASERHLRLAINLPFRNQEALGTLIKDLYDPNSPSFHHFLTVEEFTAAFGPTKEDYQSVMDFARAKGLTLTGTRANRALIEVEGPVANVEKAFHVNLGVYPHPTERRNYFAPDVEPSLDLNVPVLAIAGLSDYLVPHPASLHARRKAKPSDLTPQAGSAGGLYIGQDFRGAYAQGVTNTGAGQSVALLEFDSYYASDITSYLKNSSAGLSGSGVILSNIVVGSLTGPPGDGNVEVALDIEMAISMAPGLSTIYVYEATNSGAESDVILSRIASDNLAHQISSSWTGFDDAGTEQAFLEYAAQGQSYFQASGDSGEYNSRHNPVEPPSDSTNVTSVGGTTLSTSAGTWSSETTWNWFTTPMDGLSNNATSGGTSTTYLLPPWQSGISMSANQGSSNFRNLPDVAMVANQIYVTADNGATYFVGGTSAAAPLWAGLAALINQQRASQGQPPEGFLNPALYSIGKGSSYSSCFHDITVGNNTNTSSSRQFFAVTGYDLCTGWGTPIGSALINALSPEPMSVTTSGGFISSGPYGGPFSVTSHNYILTNVATASYNWGAGASSPWLTASPSSGAVASGVTTTVNFALNSAGNALHVGTYTNTILFTNLSDGATQSFQVVLTITQAVPNLTWTSPASVTYGTSLSSNQLDATANVPGIFSYNPDNGAVLNSGNNTLSVNFTPTDATDYTSAAENVALTVTPASLSVTAGNASRFVGQANPAFTGSIVGVVNNDDISAAYNCSATNGSPAGTYPIIPSLIDPNNRQANYSISLTNGTLTVQPAGLTVTWTNPASIAYGTALTTNQLNASANVSGSFAYFPTNGSVLDTGTNALLVVFTPTDTVDYSTTTNTVALVVSPAQLIVTADNLSKVYGQANPLFTGTATGITNGDDILASYNCSVSTNSPVGAYSITPTLADPNNRQTNYTISLNNGTLTVNQATPGINWADPTPITYGTCVNSNQLNASATVSGNFTYTPTNGAMLSAGTNAISAVFTPSDSLNFTTVPASVSLVVAPASLTVTAANANRAFSQSNPAFVGTITGVTNGDDLSAAYSCVATTNSPAGTYAIIPSLVDPNNRQTNYTLNVVDGALTIDQATASILWTNPTPIVYGIPLNSIQLNATATAQGTFAYTPSNGVALKSGTNTISVQFTPTDTVDYLGATATVSMVVSPAPLTVTAANASRPFGESNPFFTGMITGITNGDDLSATYSCVATTNSPSGTYAIIPTLVDSNNSQTNYTVSLVSGTLTVGQSVPTVSWTNSTPIVYGTALSSIQLNATASVAGNLTYIPSMGAVLNSGTNSLCVHFTPTDTVDYVAVTNTVCLVVLPAPLTVTAANANRLYGQTNPVFTGTITGLTTGDSLTATYICNALTNSPVGTYSIVPTLVDPSSRQTNYAVNLVNGTLTIGQTTPTILWTNPVPIVYGTALGIGQLNAKASVAGTYVYTPTNGATLNVGTNTISLTFTPSDTLDFSPVTANVNLIVTPALFTVTAGNAIRPFGQENPTFTGTISGVTNGDNITATYLCNATNDSPAGQYLITPLLLDPNGRQTNYTVSLVNGELTIGQAAPTIIWSNPAPISYGTPLGAIQLNAGTSAQGTFSYFPTNGTILDTGTNAVSVRFTPTDTVDYIDARTMVSVVVTPALLTVTADNATRAFGQANPVFTGSIVGVTNGDGINVSFSSTATANSPIGSYSIVPMLIDPNSRQTNYAVTLVDGTLNIIDQAAPVIAWASPASFTYGTLLSSIQLNAAASVAGTFSYTPANGALLNAGTNLLTVLFTPVDTTDFSNASNTVTVVVTPAPVSILSGVTANNKIFDGMTAASLSFSNVVLSGVLNGDTVTVNSNAYSATFATAGIGHAISVTVTGLTPAGVSSANYTLAQPESLAANIVSPILQMTGNSKNFVISWPANASAYVLEETQSLTPPVKWTPVTNGIASDGSNNSVGIDTSSGAKFFELVATPQ